MLFIAMSALQGRAQRDAFDELNCLIRRGNDDVDIVGTMLRPAWENRWDVVDADGSAEGLGLREDYFDEATRREFDEAPASSSAPSPIPRAWNLGTSVILGLMVGVLALSIWALSGR